MPPIDFFLLIFYHHKGFQEIQNKALHNSENYLEKIHNKYDLQCT